MRLKDHSFLKSSRNARPKNGLTIILLDQNINCKNIMYEAKKCPSGNKVYRADKNVASI